MKQYLQTTLLLLLTLVIGGGKAVAQQTETFDFVDWKFDGASDWDSSYAEHTVNGTICNVTFNSADKNSSTITDCPVTKGSHITVTLKNTGLYTITGVELKLKQWGSKAQTVTLSTSTDGSGKGQ